MASLKYSANSSLQTVTLGAGYTSGSGTMTLTTGHGARLPATGDFWLAYDDGAGTIRLFKVTARSTDTLTVTADATEGSGDGNITSGETLRWALTAAALTQLITDIAGMSGWVLRESQTASSSATLNFTSWYSADYDDYAIVISNLKVATSGVQIRMRMSVDGGSNYLSGASDYQWSAYRTNGGGQANHGSTAASTIGLNNTQANTTSRAFNSTLTLCTPASSDFKQVHGTSVGFDSVPDGYMNFGVCQTTSAVNAFQFYASSGNLASGTIRVYGIRKS
jgi:hypothetical protein